MRCLEANKRVMWLSRREGAKELVDEAGFPTGEYVAGWGAPERVRVNVSFPTGSAAPAPYGDSAAYDLALVADDNRWGIAEGDRMWLGDDEPDPEDPSGSYTVERVSPSLQFVSFGLRRAV